MRAPSSCTPSISFPDDVKAASVACGVANTLGNKGACAVAFNIGKTAVLCVCAHLAAGQRKVDARNRDARRIEAELPLAPSGFGLEARLAVAAEAARLAAARGAGAAGGVTTAAAAAPSRGHSRNTSAFPVAAAPARQSPPSSPGSAGVAGGEGSVRSNRAASQDADDDDGDAGDATTAAEAAAEASAEQASAARLAALNVPALVSERYDRVIWLGDLNYRIDRPREEVDELIAKGELEVRLREPRARSVSNDGALRASSPPPLPRTHCRRSLRTTS